MTDSTERLAKALSHPVRIEILRLVAERGEASPNEVHREIGEQLSTVSYHAKTLVTQGLIELGRTEPRRGAVEHFYRMAPNAPSLFKRASASVVSQVINAGPRQESKEGNAPAWLSLRVDEQGAKAISTAVKAAEDQVLRAVAESDKRLTQDNGSTGRYVRVAFSFCEISGPEPPSSRSSA